MGYSKDMVAWKLAVSFWLLIISLFLAPLALAKEASVSALPATISTTSPIFTDLLVHNIFHSFSCLSVGVSVIGQPCLSYKLTKNAQGLVQGVPVLAQVDTQGGAMGGITSFIGLMYANQPVRTADYLAILGHDLGIKEARAQGVTGSGSDVLNPIVKLWQVSRNMAYVAMIAIFVVIGVMVMFRQRINPQTVITAQAALPGLIIGLILITFSYFLAALIADFSFVATNLVGYYFQAAQPAPPPGTTSPESLGTAISGENVLSIFSKFVGIVNKERAADAIGAIFNNFDEGVKGQLRLFAGLLTAQFLAPIGSAAGIVNPVAGLVTGIALGALGGLLVASDIPAFFGLVMSIVATFILIYTMLKLLLRLITSYLTIIFLTFTAPFHFLFASLPGRQGIATNWIRNMLGNILVFPAVLAVFYFVAFIMGQNICTSETTCPIRVSDSLVPSAYAVNSIPAGTVPVTGTTALPLLGGMDLSFIRLLLAFGALMALPGIPDLVVRTVGKVGQAGQLLGQEISGGLRSGQGYAAQERGAINQQAGRIKENIFGEETLIYHPGENRYVAGIGRVGVRQWLDPKWQAKDGGVTPSAKEGGVR